ncbi:MAG: hypothetical protein KGH78_04420 [Candidatus Micrarchaeota archaeon]|nr:hypothetical protein [Candidatus Micrarchaeota archaeon]
MGSEKQSENKEKSEMNVVLRGLKRAGEAVAVVGLFAGIGSGAGALGVGIAFAKIGAVVKPIVSGLSLGNVVDGGMHGFQMGAEVGAIAGSVIGGVLGIVILKSARRK